MKNKLLSGLRYLALLSIGLVLLWLTFRHENLGEIFQKLKSANPYWLSLSIVFALVAFVSRAARWILLMEPLGYKPPLNITLYALITGYFANLAIPRIGEITRCGVLSGAEKVPFNSLIGTVIVERVIDLLMLFFTMFLVAILEFDLLSSFLMEKVVHPITEKFAFLNNPIVIFVSLALLFVFIFLIVRFSRKKENEHKLVTKIRGVLHEISRGLKSVLRMKNKGWFLFHTFLIWFMYFMMTWVCFFCLDATKMLDMKAGLFVLVVGGLGMSAPVQGGIGAYHYIVSQGLQIFNITETDGIVYATLVHTSQTLLVVVLGLISLLMLSINKKKSIKHEPR